MIVSTVNGRARVRAASKAAARIAAEVAALPGVVDARPNAGAGCLTVTFDADRLDAEVLEERIETLCQAAERAAW
jgi:allophanate hydrolase subunit 1